MFRLHTSVMDEVLAFLDGGDLVRLGGASRNTMAAATARLDSLAAQEHWLQQPQALSLVHGLSQDIVLRLQAKADREDRQDAAQIENGRWMRPRGAAQNPRANLMAKTSHLLGVPLIYGNQTWHAATRFFGFEPFSGGEWWVRPGLLEAVAVALLDPHCAFCGIHLHADEAEDVIYELGAPHNVRQVCGTCNRIQNTHHHRFLKNSAVRSARLARRAWKWCTRDNPECYQYHHASQDHCDCACHAN
jgi:hypothetical protein